MNGIKITLMLLLTALAVFGPIVSAEPFPSPTPRVECKTYQTATGYEVVCPTPSPTATPTVTPSPTATPTPLIGPTATPTPTASPTPVASPTPRVIPTPAPPIIHAIPPPSGMIVRISKIPPGERGNRYQQADQICPAGKCSIIDDESATDAIRSTVTISPWHTLYVGAKRLNFDFGKDDTGLRFSSHSSLYGAGWDKTIFVGPPNGYRVIELMGHSETINGFYATGITDDVEMGGFSIEGINRVGEGGVRSVIDPGNAHNSHFFNLWLRDLASLGLTIGGIGLTGNHADNVLVEDCIFDGMGAQALNNVNGQNLTFRRNQFHRTGLVCSNGLCGATCLDNEPNAPEDATRNLLVQDTLIDSSDSQFQHGNGVLIQNTVHLPNFGPVLIERLQINGGYRISSGLYLVFATNTLARDVIVSRTLHSGIRLDGSDRAIIQNSESVSCGTGGINAVELISTIGARLESLVVQMDLSTALGNTNVIEMGTSDANTLASVTGNITLIGPHSVANNDKSISTGPVVTGAQLPNVRPSPSLQLKRSAARRKTKLR